MVAVGCVRRVLAAPDLEAVVVVAVAVGLLVGLLAGLDVVRLLALDLEVVEGLVGGGGLVVVPGPVLIGAVVSILA